MTLLYGAEFGVGDVPNLVVREVKAGRACAQLLARRRTPRAHCRLQLNSSHDTPLPQFVQPVHEVVFVGTAGFAKGFDGKASTDTCRKACQLVRSWRELCQPTRDDCVHARWEVGRREPRRGEVVSSVASLR